ncbi:hypothetical protein ACFQV2_20715 [Actinokineospora soli]|uniref:Uncharacterized protein n=1 Tax=Actinokineospora soli TaxID=1048753 RepID=A0ABW2TQP4_9PSEU
MGSQVLVNQPTEALLRVSLVPTGNGWADVAQVMVELHSDAAYGHPAKATIPLRRFDEGATWVVPLADAAKRSYRHRWTASFTNGQLESTPWREVADGDAVLPVLVDRAGIDVTVIGDALDFTACPLTEVSLGFTGTPGVEPVTFLFRDKAPQRWHVDVPEGTPVDYTWSATHYPTGRDPIALPARREVDPFVVLPAYQAAVAGELRVQVLASLVDFAATPVVGVDLRYSDPANDLSAATSMTLEKAAPTGEWVLPIKDRRVTGFDCRITYYGADGAEHAGEWTTRSVPRVIVPARRA